MKLAKPFKIIVKCFICGHSILGKCLHHNALSYFSNPLQQQQQFADGTPTLSMESMLPAAERIPDTAHVPQRSAVLAARPKSPRKSWGGYCLWFCFSPRTKRHPCSIHTGLTASVASLIIAEINDTGYPSYLPQLHNS